MGRTTAKLFHPSHGVPGRFFGSGQMEDGPYKFKSIQDHKGPYSPSDPE